MQARNANYGNGRTGRALLHAHLRNKRLTRNVTVPISVGLLVDTGAYFDALNSFRNGDQLVIIDRVAQAAFRAIEPLVEAGVRAP